MKKNTKQNILTAIIIIAVLGLVGILGYVVYDEKINNKTIEEEQPNTKNTIGTTNMTNTTNTTNVVKQEEIKEEQKDEQKEQQYVGEEETNTNKESDTQLSNDEKAIQLVKKTWGENDNSVTYSIEQKNDNIYYIAVKSNATVMAWYEVNTDTWTVSEYN